MSSRTLSRRAALRALSRSEADERPLSALLDRESLPETARPFARELASGVARHRLRLDHALSPLLRRPLDKLDAPVRAALRLAAYERLLLETPAHTVANEYAEAMRSEKLSSAVSFVNAVARRLPDSFPSVSGSLATRLSVEHSHPLWMVERYLSRLGEAETEQLLRANNEAAPLCLRVNSRRASRETVRESLRADDLEAELGTVSPQALLLSRGTPFGSRAWQNGELIAQDEAAQLVGLVANPGANDSIIDAASAPGGKATHLAELSEGARVLACDASESRLQLVRENAARLGLEAQIETRPVDMRAPGDVAPADLVLLDVPCLGTGTLRRRPDAKWRKTPEQLAQLVELQRELLDACAQLVKAGGVLVYSTCSVEAEENELQARDFSARHDDFAIQTPTHPALTRFVTPDGWLQTWPYRDGCDGAFAARWRRER